MKRLLSLALAMACNALPLSYAEQCDVQVHFTPAEQVTPIVIEQLLTAQQAVYLSLFGIHSQPIADTLVKLHQNGIAVQVNLDKKQSRHPSSLLPFLRDAGVPVLVKPSSALQHNKYFIVDPGTPHAFVLMGSWNFSKNAEKQDNSVALIQNCPGVIEAFRADFERITRRDTLK